MLKSALLVASAAFLATAPTYAGAFKCTGGILNYAFSLTGTVSNGRAIGQANIVVTQGGSVLHQGMGNVQASRFENGRSFSVSTQDPHSHIDVRTTYRSGSTYAGTMAIQSDQGNTSVAATCSVQP